MRIEELNSQVSSLYVENIRPRVSNIALTSELKRERARNSRIVGAVSVGTQSIFDLCSNPSNVP